MDQRARLPIKVLVLTTMGRKSGQLRSTPLQFEEVKGIYYVASARGTKADWYRNLVANPLVGVQVKEQHFNTCAEPITQHGTDCRFP